MDMQRPSDTSPDDRELAQLREQFPGHRIFRAVRWDGWWGDWVAALLDPAAGVYPTVIRSTPEELRATLHAEREAAASKRARDAETRGSGQSCGRQ
jgi:hypothetical protein